MGGLIQICYLLDTSVFPIELANTKKEKEEAGLMGKLMKKRIVQLKRQGVISGFTAIEGTYLGFPTKKPCNTMIYRVDYVVQDFDNAIQKYKSGETKLEEELKKVRGWQNVPINTPEEMRKIKEVRRLFYNEAKIFFGNDCISQWSAEMDALDGADPEFKKKDNRGCKNELSLEAFLALTYGSGYVMGRAIIQDGRLPKFQEALDGKYISRVIEVSPISQK